jgi:hypothetical protein
VVQDPFVDDPFKDDDFDLSMGMDLLDPVNTSPKSEEQRKKFSQMSDDILNNMPALPSHPALSDKAKEPETVRPEHTRQPVPLLPSLSVSEQPPAPKVSDETETRSSDQAPSLRTDSFLYAALPSFEQQIIQDILGFDPTRLATLS